MEGREPEPRGSTYIRSLVSFMFLGLTNNFAYVIMLSAANDILTEQKSGSSGNSTMTTSGWASTTSSSFNNMTTATTIMTTPNSSQHDLLECNKIGTGAILLADILPSLLVKLSSPLYMHRLPYGIRVVFIGGCTAASFLIVAVSHSVGVSVLGVVVASIGAGFGEITFLALTAHFHKNTVSAFSMGTGFAGVFGSLGYAGLRSAGLSAPNTLFSMMFIPVLMILSYFVILVRPTSVVHRVLGPVNDVDDETAALLEDKTADTPTVKGTQDFSLKEKLLLMKPLLKYMIPLALVYYAEYFINQGLHELLYFQDARIGKLDLSKHSQYRWFEVDYQLGVLISRSSVNLISIKHLWILPILQCANLTVLLLQVFYQFLPSIWYVFAIILFEGLLGGAAYVNTFYRISQEVAPEYKEYSMGAASIADSFGIVLAGFTSLPAHNAICDRTIVLRH